jgi:uncharacterized protein YcbK (DUF882 family)
MTRTFGESDSSAPPGGTVRMHDRREHTLHRRSFLGLGAAAAAGSLMPSRAYGATPAIAPKAPERILSFFNTHTGERVRSVYCAGGVYQPDALRELDYILRDFRVNAVKPVDPRVFDLLHELGGTLETDSPFHIISGYRSPQTNALLRERGGQGTGVASHSLHMVGQAIDIRVPGVRLQHLRDAAKSLKIGGVGFYPDLNFVHVDVGRVRYW